MSKICTSTLGITSGNDCNGPEPTKIGPALQLLMTKPVGTVITLGTPWDLKIVRVPLPTSYFGEDGKIEAFVQSNTKSGTVRAIIQYPKEHPEVKDQVVRWLTQYDVQLLENALAQLGSGPRLGQLYAVRSDITNAKTVDAKQVAEMNLTAKAKDIVFGRQLK